MMSITREEVEEFLKADSDGVTGAVRTLRLSDDEFARICELLDEPMPEATQKLLAREPVWVQETTPVSS